MRIFKKLSSTRRETHKIINRKIKNGTIMEVIFKSILFSGFLMLIVFMIFMGYYIHQRDIKHSLLMLEEESKSISSELDQYFKNIITTIDVLSYSPELQATNHNTKNKSVIKAVLAKIENNNELINRIFVGFEDNSLLINNSIFPLNYNIEDSKWFKNAIIAEDKYYSVGSLPSPEKDINAKFFISKSFDLDNGKKGVIAVDCQLDSLYSLLSAKSIFESKKVLLANATDYIVLSEAPDYIDEYILSADSNMFTKLKSSFPTNYKGEEYLVFSHQLSDPNWTIISRISYNEVTFSLIPRMLTLGFLLLIFTFVISKLLSQVLGKTIAKPVIEVSSALNSLAQGHRDIQQIKDYPQNEIGIMAESFNTFLTTTKLLKSDINELSETKIKLSNSISLLNASLESTDDGILIIDLEGNIFKWNSKFLELWQVTKEDMYEKKNDLSSPFFKEKIRNLQVFFSTISQTKAEPELITEDIIEFIDGRIIERHSFPQKINETIVGRVWRFRDITQIRESEQKYRLLFENMTSGFALHEMIYNQEGKAIDYRFLDINPAFEKFTGLIAKNIIGKRLKEVLPNSEEYWIATYGEVAKTREAITYEQFSQEFNKYFEVRAFATEPNKFATIFSDVTSRVKALNELEKEKELAQAATKAKSEFLANMSHEIRTPLNGVIGFTNLLLSTELTSSQKEFAVNANISGKALLGIISDILDFSKIEAGKMELDLVKSSVTEILEQAIDIVKFSAYKKGLDIILDIPVDFPDYAIVDPLRLKQILLNLLNNAVKFTKEGEIELNATFTPHDKTSGKFIFSIKDTGVGISEEASKSLFQAFSQADGSITRKYGGTGLGLVISNFFATKMGSHIDFVSEEDTGSEFYFAIETDYFKKATDRKNVLSGYKVLIADKNQNFIKTISKRLTYWGLEITEATDVGAIKKHVSSNCYNAILIDERLIDYNDSHKVNSNISKCKNNNKKLSIIITYCPNDNVEITNYSQQINADKILTKPLIIEDLFNHLKEAFSDKINKKDKSTPTKISFEKLQTDKQRTILIAEDVEMNMILIKTLLKKIIPNVVVYEAKNGMEAVHFFKEYSPDIILMDIQMPELDGLEASKAIKKLEKSTKLNTPIVALTAAAFSDDKEKCLKAGMVDFLTKPINIKELTNVLSKYLVR